MAEGWAWYCAAARARDERGIKVLVPAERQAQECPSDRLCADPGNFAGKPTPTHHPQRLEGQEGQERRLPRGAWRDRESEPADQGAINTLKRGSTNTATLAVHGGDRKSEPADQGNDVTLIRGNHSAYLAARIKRDAPEIAERVTDLTSDEQAGLIIGFHG